MAIKKKQWSGLFSSAKGNWATPPDLFTALHKEFSFTQDVCAESWNCKLPRFFTEADDALKREWTGVCVVNPPYGRKIGAFMRKAAESAKAGATVVCLVPARTDTRWWIETCCAASEIRWINGRVKFVKEDGQGAPAPFPSALVIFRPPAAEPDVAIHRRTRKVVLGKECHRAGWSGWFTPGLVRGNPRQMSLNFV
jgi:phage N-6-adenine-methyltransferase